MAKQGAIKAGRAFVELFIDDSKLVRGLRRASAKLKGFGRSIGKFGAVLAGLGVALATPIVFATRTFITFDDQLKTVKAIVGATEKQFAKLESQIKLLGRTTSFTAAQVASAAVELGRAGFDARGIGDALPSVLALARATGVELAEAANIAAVAIRGFGLETSETARVADVLVATANNSAQTLTDLGEAMIDAVPIASAFNLSIEETLKILGALANFSIKGSRAGNALKTIFLQLTDPQVLDRLEGLGVATRDASKNLLPVSEILKNLGQQTANIPNTERLGLLNELFGRRGITAALKVGGAEFDRLNESIDNAGGTAARTAKIMDSGLGGVIRIITSAFEGLQIAIGEVVATFANFAKQIAKGIGAITKLVEKNKELVKTILVGIVAITAVGAVLLVLGALIIGVGLAIGGLVTITTLLGTVITSIIAVATAILSPIGFLGVAIIGLTGVFLILSDTIEKAMGVLLLAFTAVKTATGQTFEGIAAAISSGNIQLAIRILTLEVKLLWTQMIDFLIKKWEVFRDTIVAIAKALTPKISAVIGLVTSSGDSKDPLESTVSFPPTQRLVTGPKPKDPRALEIAILQKELAELGKEARQKDRDSSDSTSLDKAGPAFLKILQDAIKSLGSGGLSGRLITSGLGTKEQLGIFRGRVVGAGSGNNSELLAIQRSNERIKIGIDQLVGLTEKLKPAGALA